ncbi:OTU domain-containing protein 3 isoform X1 [Phascolarctos cinereus]|uniref:OTU domain-containing protein 3 n=1 Tax=Phascolarctos cinereus TaxID=38626 RepID=A0A6P5J3A6_PHACI|nr:OTU domain-containing protein 3 isoform X1 [Phascolarctos cinereus]
MSRKQAVKSRPGSGRKAEAERKRDERAARRALAKERRNRTEPGAGGEEEFVSFANQLQALGLKLREVPGDGNCLFRALGDQLEGHSRNHLRHRQETVDYMIRQRDDFEPFVEDDIPFEKHVASLAKPGTFAGNDAIVAFARNHQMNVVIHQLNAPLWQIRGTDKANVRELHIAYRYGEHYDSVRRINDNSEAPAHLQTDVSMFQMLNKDDSNKREKIKPKEDDFEDDLKDEVEDAVQKVCNATGCSDVNLIVQNLEAENYNIESAILAMVQMNQGKRNPQYLSLDEAEEKPEICGRAQKQRGSIWEEGGSGNRIFGNQGLSESGNENNKTQSSPVGEIKTSKSQPLKVTNKQKREQQRLEKKKRQEERHRQRAQENRSNNPDNNRSEADASAQVTLVKTFAALNI